MKLKRSLALLLILTVIGFIDFSAEAGWKSFKKKIEKTANKENKNKKIEEMNSAGNTVFAENFGTGKRKTGGTTANLELSKLKDSDNLKFTCKSGSCRSVTIHGRTSNGVWTTLYQGELNDVNVGSILAGKRKKYSHLIISVNGAHEKYDKVPAKIAIMTLAGMAGTMAESGKMETANTEKKETTVATEDKNTSGIITLDAGKGTVINVSNTEYADLKFTVKGSKQKRYYVTVANPDGVDCASDGYAVEKFDHLFYDSGFTKGVTGYDYGWKDNYPKSYFYSSYDLKGGTYYLRVNNVCRRYKNDKVKLTLKLSETKSSPYGN